MHHASFICHHPCVKCSGFSNSGSSVLSETSFQELGEEKQKEHSGLRSIKKKSNQDRKYLDDSPGEFIAKKKNGS